MEREKQHKNITLKSMYWSMGLLKGEKGGGRYRETKKIKRNILRLTSTNEVELFNLRSLHAPDHNLTVCVCEREICKGSRKKGPGH